MFSTLSIFCILALTMVRATSSDGSDVKKDSDTRGNDMQDRAIGPRVDNLATHITPRYAAVYVDDANASDAGPIPPHNRTPVIDSLIPPYHPSQVSTSSDHQKMVTITIAFVVAVVGLCAIAVMVFFLVRYYMRRAAIKRRRQASWILRSGQWNTEAKQGDAHGTRTGCSDTSSFSAYPYPLSEHF